nr:MAG TPA: hypothetical protein [Caudoviricetes sp.]
MAYLVVRFILIYLLNIHSSFGSYICISHLILFVKYKFQFSFWDCKYQFRF